MLLWSRTQWVKAVAKGWFQMLFGRLVSGGKCYPPTPADARGSAPGNNDRSARTQSFGAELNGLKPWRRGGFRCFGWKAFGRLLVEAFWEAG